MKYLINFLGFLVKATLAAFALALLLIFLATLTTGIGLEWTFPDLFSSIPDRLQFLEPPLNAIRSAGSFIAQKLQFLGAGFNAAGDFIQRAGKVFLVWGHRIMVYAIIGGMIYFILSILKNW